MKGNHRLGLYDWKPDEWTDCDHTKSAKYAKPPYWIDKNNSCDMTPQALGIEVKGEGKYVVVDSKTLGEYFPGAQKEMKFYLNADVTELRFERTVRAWNCAARFGKKTTRIHQTAGL